MIIIYIFLRDMLSFFCALAKPQTHKKCVASRNARDSKHTKKLMSIFCDFTLTDYRQKY